MGLISMFYFPWGDQYAYYNDLEECKYLDFSQKFDLSSLMIIRELNLINIFIFIAAKLNFSLEIVRFLLTTIGTSLVFSIFIDLDKNNKLPINKRFRLCLFIIMWLSVPYYLITYGFRNGFGACVLVYGVYLMFVKTEISKGFCFFLLACLIHYSYLIHLILFTFVYFYKGSLSTRKTLIISIVVYLFSMAMFSLLYGYIPFLDTIMDFYVYGDKYGAGSYDWSSSASKELWVNGVLNTAVMFYICFNLKVKSRMQNLILSLFILCVFSLTYALLFQRIVRTLVPILAFYIVLNHKHYIIKKTKYVIILVLTVAFLYPFILHREKYAYAHLERIMYNPLPIILSNHYDSATINSRVDAMGSFY